MTDKTRRERVDSLIKEIEETTNYTILSEMKAFLNSVYGEERNQIVKPSYDTILQLAREESGEENVLEIISTHEGAGLNSRLLKSSYCSYQIIIHFPTFTITNGSKNHEIKDMYVRLLLRPSGTIKPTIYGVRTTLTEAELLSHYIHSHLPRLDPGRIMFNDFCTGVGEINQVLALLGGSYSAANFMMLLMHIKNYLEWESREGTPYISIDSIFRRSGNLRDQNYLSDWLVDCACGELIAFMKRNFYAEEMMQYFNCEVNEREIKLRETPALEKMMGEIISTWNITERFGYSGGRSPHVLLSIKDGDGNYFAIPTSERTISYQKDTILIFKGKELRLEIIEKSKETTYEPLANPKVTKKICEKLSSELTRTALSSTGIKSGSSLIYNS